MGFIYIFFGVVFGCLYLAIVLGDAEPSITPITSGFILLLLGVLFLTRKYFEYDENSLTLYNMLGNVKSKYKFSSLQDIELEGKKLYVVQGDSRKKNYITAYMVDKEDWQAFLDKITIK